MGDRRELRAFAVVVLLIGVVSATTFVSCGGGGGGDSNGNLCEQCGDTDGPCNAAGASTSGGDRPSGCTTDPCQVELRCVRKVDSGQRRCFPVDPSTNKLDLRYECDGSRPIESFVPTVTPVPSVTLTPSATATPASPGPTATGPTPSATGLTPTPTATATPDESQDEVDVSINVETSADALPPFTATVSYTAAKGSFTPLDCQADDDGFVAQDSGSGILTLTFASNPDGFDSVSTTCVFHQLPGNTLVDGDLNASVDPASLTITIDEL